LVEPHALNEWLRAKCNPLTAGEYADLNRKNFIGRNLKPDEPPMGISVEYWSYLMQKNDHATDCLAKIRKDRLTALLTKYDQ